METERIDVLCINCSEMVPAEQISEHSQRCLQVQPYVLSMENSEYLRLLDFKIEKLKLAMVLSVASGLTVEDVYSLSMLADVAGKLLRNYGVSEPALTHTDEALMQLTTFLKGFKGNVSVSLYGERLKALAADKSAELRKGLEEQGKDLRLHNRQIEEKDQEIDRLKRELAEIRERPRATNSPKVQRQEIAPDEFRSNSANPSRKNSQLLVKASPNVEPLFDSSPQTSHDPVDLSNMTPAERQRYFFSQCLAIKLTFSAKDKAQYIKIPQLYEKAKSQNVEIADWPNFIRSELSRA